MTQTTPSTPKFLVFRGSHRGTVVTIAPGQRFEGLQPITARLPDGEEILIPRADLRRLGARPPVDGRVSRARPRTAQTGVMKMSTSVTIHAQLPSGKEVRVKIVENGNTVEEFTLQDGERAIRYLRDGREISVLEAMKLKATPSLDQAGDG